MASRALVLAVLLDANGAVLSASPSRATGLSATAVACLAARVGVAQFAPPAAGSATVVSPVTAGVMR